MTITVELPDDVATHENPGREALEALAIEGYRSGQLTQRGAAALLDLYWLEFEGLLKDRGVMEGAYRVEKLAADIESGDELRAAGLIPRMIVVSDTSPFNYLLQIGLEELVHGLYGSVLVPEAVVSELQARKAPEIVRRWSNNLPAWIEVRRPSKLFAVPGTPLDLGERAALQLALDVGSNLMLIDEWKATQIARSLGFIVVGTLEYCAMHIVQAASTDIRLTGF